MLGKPSILSLFPTRLINSIKHEHSCKILYTVLTVLSSLAIIIGEEEIAGEFAYCILAFVCMSFHVCILAII